MIKVREGGRVVKVAVMVATGVNADGYREVLGIQTSSTESGSGWLTFFRDLVARGLTGVAMVTSDAHAGLVDAIGATLPNASWQRCRTHYAKNLSDVTPKSSQPWVKTLLHSVYDQPDAAAVRDQFDRIIDALTDRLPDVAEHLESARDDVLAFTAFPKVVWKQVFGEQPQRAPQPRNPPAHRRGRDLPQPRRNHPALGAVLAEHSPASGRCPQTNGPSNAATSALTPSPPPRPS